MKKSILTALFASILLCGCSTPSVYNAIAENGEVSMEKFHEEIQKGLIQIILYRIVRNRIVIQNIKEGVKL